MTSKPTKILFAFFFAFFIFKIFLFSAFAQSPKQNFNRVRTFDVQHYTIRTSFDRKNKTVFGDTTILLKPLADDFKTLELDAAGMRFDSVKLEPENTDLEFRLKDEKIYIDLGKAFKKTATIAVRLKYSTKPKKGIYFVDEERNGKKIVRSEQIYTQNEPDQAHFWFPSYDFPDDKATSEQFITADGGEDVIANGELVEKKENADGTNIFHFKMPVKHSVYVISFVIGKYSKTSDFYGDVPLGIYVYPGEESIVPLVFGDTKEMFRIFEDLTGIKYPFNKYDQTIVSKFGLGGMENITATTLSDKDIFLARFPQYRGVVLDIISHEIAHSWFGNLVTCRNWAELWLNEGFATYMEAAYREKIYGNGAYLSKIREDAREYIVEDAVNANKHALFNLTADKTDQLFKYPSISYNKGSAVIHTLRQTVGEKVFWKAVGIYLKRHRLGNVETSDLKKVMEETSGKNLDVFFQQWVYSTGYPKLEITPNYDPAKKILKLRIRQVQKTESLTPAVFVFPMEIFIQTEQGEQTEKFEINRREQTVSIKLEHQPTDIVFDKNLLVPLLSVKSDEIKKGL